MDIAGDDEMGRSSRFRRELRGLQEKYVLAIPSDTNIRDLEAPCPAYRGRGRVPLQPFQRVDRWADSQSQTHLLQLRLFWRRKTLFLSQK